MKKLIAIVALVSLLAIAGCAQGTASPSAGASSAGVASTAMPSQSTGASAGQVQGSSAGASVAGPAASAGNGALPEPGVANETAADSLIIGVGDTQLVAELADTDAARALAERLQDGPVSLSLHAYGGFEKVGPLPWALPQSDAQLTTEPGDVMLYQGDQITIFTAPNSWAYTPLGHIGAATSESLIEALGDGDVAVTLSLR